MRPFSYFLSLMFLKIITVYIIQKGKLNKIHSKMNLPEIKSILFILLKSRTETARHNIGLAVRSPKKKQFNTVAMFIPKIRNVLIILFSILTSFKFKNKRSYVALHRFFCINTLETCFCLYIVLSSGT